MQILEFLQIGLIIFPPIITGMIYFLGNRRGQNKWRAIHRAVQYSACFYIAAVSCLLNILFGSYFIGIILIILLTLLSIILIVQRWKRTEVILKNGLKILWRVTFLFFSLTYISLLFYWLVIFIYKQIG